MAVHIRLARHGTKKAPFYRIVVTDQRNPRDGRFIENIGTFDPSGKLELNRARFDYWKGQGAIPSETLYQLVKKLPTAPAEPGTPA